MVLCRSRQGPGLPTQWWWCYCGVSCHTAVWRGLSPVGTATDTNTSPGCDSVGDSPGGGSRGKSLLMSYFDFDFVLTILENANTYIIIVNYITKTLVRSFVLVVGSPTTTTTTSTTTTTIAGRVPVPALQHSLH